MTTRQDKLLNIYKFLLATSLTAVSLFGSSGMASTLLPGDPQGTATGGGGQVNVENVLLDFDPKTCVWISGPKFIEKHKLVIENILTEIDRSHWYLASAFRREIKKINFCEAGKLKLIDVTDKDSLAAYDYEDGQQMGIRLNNSVYVDMTLFNSPKTKKPTKNYFFVHEIAHSFLPMNLARRNDSLRSFTKMLSQGRDADSLALNIRSNNLEMPEMASELEDFKSELLVYIDESTPLMKRIEAAQKLDVVKDKLYAVDKLTLEGNELLSRNLLHQRNILFLNIINAIKSGNLDVVKRLYESQDVKAHWYLTYTKEKSSDWRADYKPYTAASYDPNNYESGDFSSGNGFVHAVANKKWEIAKYFVQRHTHAISEKEFIYLISRKILSSATQAITS